VHATKLRRRAVTSEFSSIAAGMSAGATCCATGCCSPPSTRREGDADPGCLAAAIASGETGPPYNSTLCPAGMRPETGASKQARPKVFGRACHAGVTCNLSELFKRPGLPGHLHAELEALV